MALPLDLPDMVLRYGGLLAERSLALLVLCGIVVTAAMLLRRALPGRPSLLNTLGRVALVPVGLWGLWRVYETRSCVDDAFISFRYAENFGRGMGLVFNEGEYVEGYTNFLWTIALALVARFSALDVPQAALFACLLSYVLCVPVLVKVGRKLNPEGVHVPLAAGLFSVNLVICAFATTGMESAACALAVLLGAWALLEDGPTWRFAGGLAWIIATLLRPDQAVFYAVGAAVVVAESYRKRSAVSLAAYALPFLLWMAVTAGRYAYYGDVFPNTYYAKAAGSWFPTQGFNYTATLLLGAHFWAVLLLSLGWMAAPSHSESESRLKAFVLGSALLFELYVLKVGGDFMYGRFFVPLIPLGLLGAEAFVHRVGRRRFGAGVVAAALLACTAEGVDIIQRGRYYGVANESRYYPLKSHDPIEIDHANYEVGTFFKRVFTDRGLRPVVATSGIGMAGYFSQLMLIDTLGLTDAVIARGPHKDGLIGHQRRADPEYLRQRKVDVIRMPRCSRPLYQETAGLRFQGVATPPWCIFAYRRELWDQVRRVAPEVSFPDVDAYFDRYLAELPAKQGPEVRSDLEYFDTFYFRWNADPRRRVLARFLREHEERPVPLARE